MAKSLSLGQLLNERARALQLYRQAQQAAASSAEEFATLLNLNQRITGLSLRLIKAAYLETSLDWRLIAKTLLVLHEVTGVDPASFLSEKLSLANNLDLDELAPAVAASGTTAEKITVEKIVEDTDERDQIRAALSYYYGIGVKADPHRGYALFSLIAEKESHPDQATALYFKLRIAALHPDHSDQLQQPEAGLIKQIEQRMKEIVTYQLSEGLSRYAYFLGATVQLIPQFALFLLALYTLFAINEWAGLFLIFAVPMFCEPQKTLRMMTAHYLRQDPFPEIPVRPAESVVEEILQKAESLDQSAKNKPFGALLRAALNRLNLSDLQRWNHLPGLLIARIKQDPNNRVTREAVVSSVQSSGFFLPEFVSIIMTVMPDDRNRLGRRASQIPRGLDSTLVHIAPCLSQHYQSQNPLVYERAALERLSSELKKPWNPLYPNNPALAFLLSHYELVALKVFLYFPSSLVLNESLTSCVQSEIKRIKEQVDITQKRLQDESIRRRALSVEEYWRRAALIHWEMRLAEYAGESCSWDNKAKYYLDLDCGGDSNDIAEAKKQLFLRLKEIVSFDPTTTTQEKIRRIDFLLRRDESHANDEVAQALKKARNQLLEKERDWLCFLSRSAEWRILNNEMDENSWLLKTLIDLGSDSGNQALTEEEKTQWVVSAYQLKLAKLTWQFEGFQEKNQQEEQRDSQFKRALSCLDQHLVFYQEIANNPLIKSSSDGDLNDSSMETLKFQLLTEEKEIDELVSDFNKNYEDIDPDGALAFQVNFLLSIINENQKQHEDNTPKKVLARRASLDNVCLASASPRFWDAKMPECSDNSAPALEPRPQSCPPGF